MLDDFSFGIIPLRKSGADWDILLVKHHSGHWWGFPKGHPEEGENGKQTAIRELLEETGLNVKQFLNDKSFIENYTFTHNGLIINKTVTYYIAEVEGELLVQTEELMDCQWFPINEANKQLTYPESQSVLCKAQDALDSCQ